MAKKLLLTVDEYALSIKASFAFEGLDLDEEAVENCKRIIKGEISSDAIVADLVAKYSIPNKA